MMSKISGGKTEGFLFVFKCRAEFACRNCRPVLGAPSCLMERRKRGESFFLSFLRKQQERVKVKIIMRIH